ncbi:MAG: hypothetical protein M1435_03005, partial [Actinobacteria bacterium]|nr:hypothetical protein [Actinomycetota bacterium]
LADAQSTARDGRSFSLRLAFARHLSPERRLGLLQQRRALVAERLSQLTACAARPCSDRYVQLLAEHEQDNLSADLSWLDRLITQEQSGAAPGQGNWGKGRGIPLASASQLRRSHFTNKVAAATN